LGMKDTYGMPVPSLMVNRPPSLCSGCPHIDSFKALNEVMEECTKGHVFSDIGCYTLGALNPTKRLIHVWIWALRSLWQKALPMQDWSHQ